MEPNSSTVSRLEDELAYYSTKSQVSRQRYYAIKSIQIVASAAVSVSALTVNAVVAAFLGALVVILEGYQGLFRFHDQWMIARTTCNSLKREKFLWLAKAGPYALPSADPVLLAERIEAILSDEHGRWADIERKPHTTSTASVVGGNAR